MKRRDFVKGSLATGVALAGPGVAFVRGSAQSAVAPMNDLLTAQMIWSAESVPMQVGASGTALSIASSGQGSTLPHEADLHSVFLKEFTLDVVPAYALMRLFSYTRYRLYINGVYQGRGPSRFQNQRPEYDSREIVKALRVGVNRIAVLVHRDSPTGRIMRHDAGFAALIELGIGRHKQTIGTDTTWLSKPDLCFGPRPVAWASIEENIDARNGPNWTDDKLSLTQWAPSIPVGGPDFFPLWPRMTPLQPETPVAWTGSDRQWPVSLKVGETVSFDLAQIIQGYHVLDMDAAAGSELEIAYYLPEGKSSGKCSYITREGMQTYMGGDTFAFNQLAIKLKSGRVSFRRAQAIEVRYPFERVASFKCSDPMLNQLWAICARSLELLSEDSYVDCADRERVEWTDDSPPAFDCTRVMMRGPNDGEVEHWADSRLLGALLRRIALTQRPDGQIKAHSCSERWDIHAIMEDRSCDWVVQLREYFESSGDAALVRELWPTITRLMNWFLEKQTARGLVQAREWEVWDNPLRYQVCEGAGLNAMVYRALSDAAFLGRALGNIAEGDALADRAARLQADFNAALWNSDEGTYDGALFGPGSKTTNLVKAAEIVDGRYRPTVQAALFAIYGGIVPEEHIASVRQWVLANLAGVKQVMSHYYLFRMLYEMEEEERDLDALQRMRIGWKPQVESPWQTTWEELADARGSKAHIYGMVPGHFLTAFVLGARRIGHISSRSILIEPRCGGLTSAAGVAVTEFGPVKMKWSKSDHGGISIECELPPMTTTTLRLYRRGDNETIMIDQQPQYAHTRGRFLEVPLPPGSHVIQYNGARTG
jgi:alpha-L-rhamnosidase